MRLPWVPIILCAVVADVNFWYFASTGENHADYLGIVFFLVFAAYSLRGSVLHRDLGFGVAALGSLLAVGTMALREANAFDRGYIPPYFVFVVFALIGAAFSRSSSSERVGARG